MYQVRKRARPGGEENERPCSTRDGVGAAAAGRREAAWTPPTAPSGRDASRRGDKSSGVERGQGLMPPARYYTSTQPDIEDSGGGGCGAIGWPAVVEGGGSGEGRIGRGPMPPPLFTREELAPTYHIVGGASTPSGGAVANGQAGADGGGGVNGAAEAAAGGGAAVLGCPHYRRACKMRAPCCQKLFTCRLCHDQASDHTVDRGEVKEMLCMRCGTLQPMHRCVYVCVLCSCALACAPVRVCRVVCSRMVFIPSSCVKGSMRFLGFTCQDLRPFFSCGSSSRFPFGVKELATETGNSCCNGACDAHASTIDIPDRGAYCVCRRRKLRFYYKVGTSRG